MRLTVSVLAAEPSYDLCIPNATTSDGSPGAGGSRVHPDDPAPGVFDFHQHYGPVPGWRASAGSAAEPIAADAAARLRIMDRFGIAHACIQPSSGYERPEGTADLIALNDAVAALRDEAPDRFVGALGSVDLGLGVAAVVRETKRALDDLGLDGLAWHHRLQGAYIDDPRMRPVLDLLAERHKLACIHLFADSTFESPWRLENLAEEYRQVQFVAMDAFSSYDRACWMSRIAAHHPNLVFDTAAMTTSSNVLANFVAGAGPERLLLGTNLYGAQQTDYFPAALEAIRASSALGAQAKALILGGNARRVLGKTRSRDRAGTDVSTEFR